MVVFSDNFTEMSRTPQPGENRPPPQVLRTPAAEENIGFSGRYGFSEELSPSPGNRQKPEAAFIDRVPIFG
jgi:hypothetical protein